jgi:demethylspheroidene O-methyltransferase
MPGRRSLSAWRDRLLMSPRFQRIAAAFPLTRRIARRHADALFDLCAGFVYSQILYACVELRLFEILRGGPLALAPLARRLDLAVPAAQRLLDAACALQLVERRGKTYGLGPLGAAVAGNPSVAAMVTHHAHLYADLRDPVALLRGEARNTALSAYWPYAGAEDPASLRTDSVAAYSELMSTSQPLVAEEVLDAYDMRQHRCLLDVGGGEGAFLAAAAARAPDLQLKLFDLPAVAERTRARLARDGLAARADVHGGSFLTGPLPQGADIVSLVRVILDHDDANALTILKAAHRALPPGGTLLLAEPMADVPGGEAMGAAYFGFYLMAMGRGRARTRAELADLLVHAGFHAVSFRAGRRILRTGLLVART